MKIPITKPFFGQEEREALLKPLDSGWVVQGPFVHEFEQKFATFTGAAHAVATSSCTTALHLAVAVLNLQPGDEVIVPAFTWVSTANVIEYMGAKPVFCDIDLATFNIDPNRIEACITPRTVGILPVHLFGLCAAMPEILEIATPHNLWVVEDAACGLGGTIHSHHAGTFGDAGCFSFHPRKSITTGEGGMLICQRERLAEKARVLREHGASRTDLSRHEGQAGFLLSTYADLGYNYRMTDFQGALGSVQMDRVPAILQGRTRIATEYNHRLSHLPFLQLPQVPNGYTHGYQAYVCLYSTGEPSLETVDELHVERNNRMQQLDEQGIATRQGTHAAAHLEYYRKKYHIRREDFPNAWMADRLTLALPLFPQMTDEELDHVCNEVQQIMNS